jgi:metal-responsive CopG/Arc/MetJ family transcriptional regulator
MGTLKVTIPDDLEREFREEIFKSKGMKKGNISKAVEEAIRLWIKYQREERKKQMVRGEMI